MKRNENGSSNVQRLFPGSAEHDFRHSAARKCSWKLGFRFNVSSKGYIASRSKTTWPCEVGYWLPTSKEAINRVLRDKACRLPV
mmetsp:Transcript_21550/g.46717  ORF Transcript_21550/g.46717 Transcript_21550/m.46717 type:complete len:84 (-) Transcript_21550:25-276(-)